MSITKPARPNERHNLMSTRRIIVSHEGEDYFGTVMTIRSTSFGVEDHGILTANLHCEADGSGVSVGGYSLDKKPLEQGTKRSREATAYGLDFLVQTMLTAGVSKWEELPGRDIIVLFPSEIPWGVPAVGFAHLTDEGKVFLPHRHAEEWLTRRTS